VELSSEIHFPDALLPEGDPPLPIEWDAGWTLEPVRSLWICAVEKHKNIL